MSNEDSKQDSTKYVDIPLIIDGREHEYSVPLPGAGINWVKFTIDGFNFPAQLTFYSAELNYQAVKK